MNVFLVIDVNFKRVRADDGKFGSIVSRHERRTILYDPTKLVNTSITYVNMVVFGCLYNLLELIFL